MTEDKRVARDRLTYTSYQKKMLENFHIFEKEAFSDSIKFVSRICQDFEESPHIVLEGAYNTQIESLLTTEFFSNSKKLKFLEKYDGIFTLPVLRKIFLIYKHSVTKITEHLKRVQEVIKKVKLMKLVKNV